MNSLKIINNLKLIASVRPSFLNIKLSINTTKQIVGLKQFVQIVLYF